MARERIPTRRNYSGIFPGDYGGNFWYSHGIDFRRNPGNLTVADTMSEIFSSGDDADLALPVAFLRTAADSTDRWWVNGGKLFKTTNTNPEAGWTQDAISNTPTSPLYDLHEFVDDLYVPIDTNVYKLSAGTWTANWWSAQSGASALQTGVPHFLHTFAGAMLITDGRFINSWDGTIATDPALTLPSNQQAEFIRSTSDLCFIPCSSLDGSDAEVFFWDRSSDNFNARFPLEDSKALAGFQVDGIPYVITLKGAIKRFTGQGFRTVQEFPSVRDGGTVSIHPNGVTVDEATVRILVNFGTVSTDRGISGMWRYEADTNNLYPESSIVNDSGNDYSQWEVAGFGALKETTRSQGIYLAGGTAYTVYTGSTRKGIYTSNEASSSGRGFMITPKISAANVDRFWREIHPRFKQFENAADRLRFAYRAKESTTLPAFETITWVTSTTFTGTNANVAVGDFVEILAGDNAGAIAKISSIASGSPNTYTIDTTLNASTNAARARYWDFKDLGTISTQGIQKKIMRIAKRSPWIQFLIELRGDTTSPVFEGIIYDFQDLLQ